MLYSDAKPGDTIIADLGWGGVAWDVPVVVAEAREGLGVFGDPQINIRTTCGLDLVFFPGQTFQLEPRDAEADLPQLPALSQRLLF